MSYRIYIEKPARKFIQKQSSEQQKRILLALSRLPEQGDISPMKGKENQFRLRIGEYRAVYTLDAGILTVTVMKIGPRGDINQ